MHHIHKYKDAHIYKQTYYGDRRTDKQSRLPFISLLDANVERAAVSTAPMGRLNQLNNGCSTSIKSYTVKWYNNMGQKNSMKKQWGKKEEIDEKMEKKVTAVRCASHFPIFSIRKPCFI